jgi:hypothetical protein
MLVHPSLHGDAVWTNASGLIVNHLRVAALQVLLVFLQDPRNVTALVSRGVCGTNGSELFDLLCVSVHLVSSLGATLAMLPLCVFAILSCSACLAVMWFAVRLARLCAKLP